MTNHQDRILTKQGEQWLRETSERIWARSDQGELLRQAHRLAQELSEVLEEIVEKDTERRHREADTLGGIYYLNLAQGIQQLVPYDQRKEPLFDFTQLATDAEKLVAQTKRGIAVLHYADGLPLPNEQSAKHVFARIYKWIGAGDTCAARTATKVFGQPENIDAARRRVGRENLKLTALETQADELSTVENRDLEKGTVIYAERTHIGALILQNSLPHYGNSQRQAELDVLYGLSPVSLEAPPNKERKLTAAIAWLEKQLTGKEILGPELVKHAKEAGFSGSTLNRAATNLGVVKDRKRGRGWRLPE